jgi:AraC family transcriptional regulator
MKREFRTIRDYHLSARRIEMEERLFDSLRASVLVEDSGDVTFNMTAANAIVLTVDGTRKHLTRMDTVQDETPSQPGDVCLIPADVEVHLAWKNHGRHQETLMIEFDRTMFEIYTPEIMTGQFAEGHLVPANFAQRPELEQLTRIITREVDPRKARGRIYAESAIRLLSIEVATALWSAPVAAVENRLGHDARVLRAIDFIEVHFARDISLIEISAAAGLSPTHLTGVFRRHTGTTPYAYVVKRRLERAISLLRGTDMPISHVAIEAGFADQQHLTRVLRARHDATPKQVRRER